MKQIEFTQARTLRQNVKVEPGDVLPFPDDEADGYVRSGVAKYVEEKKEKKKDQIQEEVKDNG